MDQISYQLSLALVPSNEAADISSVSWEIIETWQTREIRSLNLALVLFDRSRYNKYIHYLGERSFARDFEMCTWAPIELMNTVLFQIVRLQRHMFDHKRICRLAYVGQPTYPFMVKHHGSEYGWSTRSVHGSIWIGDKSTVAGWLSIWINYTLRYVVYSVRSMQIRLLCLNSSWTDSSKLVNFCELA